MTLRIKYTGLLVGILLTFTSLLYFGRKQGTYQWLLISGILVSAIFYGAILYRSHPLKSKVICSALIILCIVVQWLTEPFLVNTSYRIFIKQHETELSQLNSILLQTQGDISVTNDSIRGKYAQLTIEQKNTLLKGRKNIGVYLISKTRDEIYYGFWGFLDVRLGIRFWTDKTEPDVNYQHLIGSWYH